MQYMQSYRPDKMNEENIRKLKLLSKLCGDNLSFTSKHQDNLKHERRKITEVEDNLINILLEKKISLHKLSDMTGINIGNLRRYIEGERNLRNARMNTIFKLTKALECTIPELLNVEAYHAYEKDLGGLKANQRLKLIREDRGVKQQEIRTQLSLARNAVTKLETGEIRLENSKFQILDGIARILNCNVTDLVAEELVDGKTDK